MHPGQVALLDDLQRGRRRGGRRDGLQVPRRALHDRDQLRPAQEGRPLDRRSRDRHQRLRRPISRAAIALPAVQGPRSRDLLQVGRARCRPGRAAVLPLRAGTIDETELLISRAAIPASWATSCTCRPRKRARCGMPAARRARFRAAALRRHRPCSAAASRRPSRCMAATSARRSRRSMCGLDRWIRFDKRDFIGREALLRVQERGHRRALGRPGARRRTCRPSREARVWSSRRQSPPYRGAARSAAPRPASEGRRSAGEQVGHVTYSARGHTVGKMLALAYVQVAHAFPAAACSSKSVAGRPCRPPSRRRHSSTRRARACARRSATRPRATSATRRRSRGRARRRRRRRRRAVGEHPMATARRRPAT